MSWAQLGAILREARETAADERRKPPVACPYDGTPLKYHPRKGLLFCPNGDYRVRGPAP